MNAFIAKTAQRILGGAGGVDRTTAQALMDAAAGQKIYDLLYWANRIRLARIGPGIRLCAIAAGKIGLCSEDCAFCGQSVRCSTLNASQTGRICDAEIALAAENAAEMGATNFGLVNSGRGPTDPELKELAPILTRLSQPQKPGLCASLGILSDAQAQFLYEHGVRRYNHNLETSRSFFPHVVSTHTYEDRLATVALVKRAGMKLCCGGIFGLGETWDDRLDLAQTLAEIAPDEVPLNFLHPLPETPLAEAEPPEPLEILRIIALFRFVLPGAQIKVAGGREANLRDLQSWIFFAGASGCLIGDYLLTKGRSAGDDQQMFADLHLPTVKRQVPRGHEIPA